MVKIRYQHKISGSSRPIVITHQPSEYYQTRTELSILEDKAPEIISRTRCQMLVELGSGSARKTRALLDAMTASFPKDPVRYVPLDVSENALMSSATRLLKEYPTLEISGFLGDFDHSLEGLLANPQPTGETRMVGPERLVAFLGGTIGNLAPERRQTFLRRLSALLKRGDHLLVGVDLIKEARVLEAAYDDATGVTTRFNKNLLNVLNRKLGGAFDPTLFAHRAVYNVEGARIEMWLDSQVAQKVPLTALGLEVPFEAGEGIRTEISAKFTRSTVEHMLEEAGFLLTGWYTDERQLFGLALGSRGANSSSH